MVEEKATLIWENTAFHDASVAHEKSEKAVKIRTFTKKLELT